MLHGRSGLPGRFVRSAVGLFHLNGQDALWAVSGLEDHAVACPFAPKGLGQRCGAGHPAFGYFGFVHAHQGEGVFNILLRPAMSRKVTVAPKGT